MYPDDRVGGLTAKARLEALPELVEAVPFDVGDVVLVFDYDGGFGPGSGDEDVWPPVGRGQNSVVFFPDGPLGAIDSLPDDRGYTSVQLVFPY